MNRRTFLGRALAAIGLGAVAREGVKMPDPPFGSTDDVWQSLTGFLEEVERDKPTIRLPHIPTWEPVNPPHGQARWVMRGPASIGVSA